MGLSLFFKFIISLLLGSVIGLERETGNTSKKKEIWTLGGVRTFALISFLGSIAGFLFVNNALGLSYIITSFIFIAILVYYFITAFKSHSTGLTTEISALLAYLIGFFLIINIIPISIIIAFSVVLILILSNKHRSKIIASRIDQHEWNSFLSFAIILLVILPFLPNINYTLSDFAFLKSINIPSILQNLEIINPYRLWLIVVLISGINLLRYLLQKYYSQNKGLYISGFFGGILSSTLTNHILAERSKKESNEKQFDLIITNIIAYIASVLHICFFIAILNNILLLKILPGLGLMILVSIGFAIILNHYKKSSSANTLNFKINNKPDILLIPAIKFAFLVTIIKIIAGLAFIYWGIKGFLLASTISSFAGVDAIIINISEMAQKTISINYAILVVLIINIANLLGKWIYSCWKGSKRFSQLNLLLLTLIFVTSFVWYLLII